VDDSSPAGQADKWFSVRCIFKDLDSDIYEERITLWKAHDFSHAIGLAEAEAREYTEAIDGIKYLSLAQAYHLADKPGNGGEIFSLIRESTLGEEEYLDAFFDTGAERQSHVNAADD
jgi:hypothetical protein